MALIKCPDCGTDVSDQAEACPRCARPIKKIATTPVVIEKRSVEDIVERIKHEDSGSPPTPKKRSRSYGCGTAILGCLGIVIVSLVGMWIVGSLAPDRPARTTNAPRYEDWYNTSSSLNIRAAPSNEAEIVGKLKFGERVRVERGADVRKADVTWVKVKSGYVAKNFLSSERPLSEHEKLAGPVPQQSGWDGSYAEVKKYLKTVMHDPSSLDWEGCTKVKWEPNRKAYLVGCIYRGTNAFGAVVRNANWFVIRHEQVIDVLDEGTHSWQ